MKWNKVTGGRKKLENGIKRRELKRADHKVDIGEWIPDFSQQLSNVKPQ